MRSEPGQESRTKQRMRLSLCDSRAVFLATAAVLLVSGFVALGADRPEWIAEPKVQDSIYVYALGYSKGQNSEDKAVQSAMDNARQNLIEIAVADRSKHAELLRNMQGVELVPNSTFRSGRECWVQASWPIQQREKLLKRVAHGNYLAKLLADAMGLAARKDWDKATAAVRKFIAEYGDPLCAGITVADAQKMIDDIARQKLESELNELWARAQTLRNQGEFGKAKPVLQTILARYNDSLLTSFNIYEARLCLGDICRDQKDFLGARRCYEDMARDCGVQKWRDEVEQRLKSLPPPPRFWAMNDRFGGRKVALLCCIREKGPCERSKELTGMLAGDCRSALLDCVDITPDLSAREMNEVFDMRKMETAQKMAAAQGAGVILCVLIDVDPKRRG